MKRILLTILLGLAGFVAMFCIVIAMQPDMFSIQRSVTMAAPREDVFDQVNDLKKWDGWSPWKDLDPNPTTTLSDPSAGKGAKFTWSGNDEVGEGTLTITDSKTDELVELEQAFVRPMEGKAKIIFTLAPEGTETRTTWRMEGKNSFLGKAMCMFMDMEMMIGPKLEQGLNNIKAIVEKRKAPVEEKTAEPQQDASADAQGDTSKEPRIDANEREGKEGEN